MAKWQDGVSQLRSVFQTPLVEGSEKEETDVSEYARKYSEYLSWSELYRRHETAIREQTHFRSHEYSHPFATILEVRPILREMMEQYRDIAEYPEFVKDLESQGISVAEVARGGRHMIASTRDGRVFTVGSNEYGALGRHTETLTDGVIPGAVQLPVENSNSTIMVSAGFSHCSAVIDGDVYVWGTFCDENGEPFGLMADSKELITRTPVKLNLRNNIVQIGSGDNHLVMLSREERGIVFTMGTSPGAIGRPYDMRGEELSNFTPREYMLTPLALSKYGPGDYIQFATHADATIIHVAMRSEKLIWGNVGKFFVFGQHQLKDEEEDNPVTDSHLNTITFKVTNRKPRKRTVPSMDKHLVEYLFPTQTPYKVICGSDFADSVPTSNGFVDTVVDAYAQHHNLVLRPDDLLTSILVQMTLFLNGQQMCQESRKQTLKLEIDTSKNLSQNEISARIIELTEHTQYSNNLKSLYNTTFSTTTIDDTIVNRLLPYSKIKKPFDYDLCVICGIPQITLLGTLEDWKHLRAQIEMLESLQVQEWLAMLRIILDECVKARLGHVDQKFWREICHFESAYGGPFINGWITAFSAISEYGEFRKPNESLWPKILKSEIVPGFLEVDLGSLSENGKVIVGHVGKAIVSNGATLQPKSGWAIVTL